MKEGTQQVCVKKEEWEVVYRRDLDGKENENYARSFCLNFLWRSKCAKECAKRIPTVPTHR